MTNWLSEVARFRAWAAAMPEERRVAEWELNYGGWDALYDAALRFVDAVPFARWSPEEVHTMLYALARDWDMRHLANQIRLRQPQTLVALTGAAIPDGEPDAKWQLAWMLRELGRGDGTPERLLLALASDKEERVRGMALTALAQWGCPAVESLALAEWHRSDLGREEQETARMGALFCLHRMASPHLEALLAQAVRDEGKYLSGYAKKIRLGEVA
jgi:hypothetical protein